MIEGGKAERAARVVATLIVVVCVYVPMFLLMGLLLVWRVIRAAFLYQAQFLWSMRWAILLASALTTVLLLTETGH